MSEVQLNTGIVSQAVMRWEKEIHRANTANQEAMHLTLEPVNAIPAQMIYIPMVRWDAGMEWMTVEEQTV